MKNIYPVIDFVNHEDLKQLGVKRDNTLLPCLLSGERVKIGAVYTGEKRPPKKGEWYLSGAIVEAYKAPNNLTTPFHIAKLVTYQEKLIRIIVTPQGDRDGI